jgi:ABC-type oligopeptide transport system ATPase subunit
MQETLKKVGLEEYHARRFPHEFSGGQRQRIGIARALALRPKFIVCDEPVSALDVSIQSQVLNILKDLQKEFGLTYLFIAHNLSVVEHISDRVAVMYLGKMVELADRDELYRVRCIHIRRRSCRPSPFPDPKMKRNRLILKGDVPSPSIPRAAAASTRAVPSRKRSARNRSLNSARSSQIIGWPAGWSNRFWGMDET